MEFKDVKELKEFLSWTKDHLKAQHIKIGDIECVFSGLSFADNEDGHLNYEDKAEQDAEDEQEKALRHERQDKHDLEDDLCYSAD